MRVPFRFAHMLVVVACASLAAPRAAHAQLIEVEPDVRIDVVEVDPLEPIERVEPQTPVRAAEHRTSGFCSLTFRVAPDGSVDSDSIAPECTSSLFARDATRAVARWRYAPSPDGADADWRPATARLSFPAPALDAQALMTPRRRQAPIFPSDVPYGTEAHCEATFAVDGEGRVDGFSIEVDCTDARFESAVSAAAAGWRYPPWRPGDPEVDRSAMRATMDYWLMMSAASE